MCGIVLMMSDDKMIRRTNRQKAFTQGVIVDTLRGPHSTGLVYAGYDGSAEIYKKPIPGYDFVNMPKFSSVVGDCDEYPFLIAHNRWATKGAINTANAHPFQHEHITGVHNGSLWSWKNLAPDQNFNTDSEYIFHALAHNDTADVLKSIDGAFALVWHDSRDNTMHIARNDERPFWLGHVKDSKTVLGVSEEEMLDLICVRNDIELSEKYLVNTEVELIFNLDDLHDPEVIERKMMEPWGASYAGKRGTTNRSGGTNTSSTTFNKPRKVCGLIDGYVPYSDSSIYGYIEAMDMQTYEEIRINGYTKEEWTWIDTKDGYFEGEVTATGSVNGDKYLICNRTNLTWLTDQEAYGKYEAGDDDTDDDDEEVGTADVPVKKLWYSKRGERLLYTKEEASHLLANGCCTCGDEVAVEDFDTIEWWNTEPICPSCSSVNTTAALLLA